MFWKSSHLFQTFIWWRAFVFCRSIGDGELRCFLFCRLVGCRYWCMLLVDKRWDLYCLQFSELRIKSVLNTWSKKYWKRDVNDDFFEGNFQKLIHLESDIQLCWNQIGFFASIPTTAFYNLGILRAYLITFKHLTNQIVIVLILLYLLMVLFLPLSQGIKCIQFLLKYSWGSLLPKLQLLRLKFP